MAVKKSRKQVLFSDLFIVKRRCIYRDRGGTPIHYLYGYVPPKGVMILKLLI